MAVTRLSSIAYPRTRVRRPSRAHVLVLAAGLLSALGCETEDVDPTLPPPSGGNGGTGGEQTVVPLPTAGTGGQGGTAGQPSVAEGIPCDIEAILVDRCQSCHGQNLVAGAPMPLVTWDDLHAAAYNEADRDAGKKVYDVVQDRVHRTGSGTMPPDTSQRLNEAELALYDAWVENGAPKVSRQACSGQPEAGAGGSGGAGGSPGIDPNDLECHEFRAHGQQVSGDTTPYNVPSGEHYVCFTFAAPWLEKVQAIATEHLEDNGAVLHHWLLYELPGGLGADGSFAGCLGNNADGSLITGWAPGANDLSVPENVGLKIPYGSQGRYRLELHYNNPGAPTTDRSGVKLCATRALREHEAGVTWLGTEQMGPPWAIPGLPGSPSVGHIYPNMETKFTGTCTPARQGLGPNEDIHIFMSWPHMHKLGTHMRTVIKRSGGGEEVLHDADFNFEFQRSYNTPAVIRPGDRLETTCTYFNTTNRSVGFGTPSDDEMCYNFVYSYPAGALDNPTFSWVGAQNTCLL